jgi:ribosomal protein L12E/L44/L45/RPP1/RPP2
VTIPADPEKEGSYAMSSYYHVGCFVLPRRLKHLGAQEFVQEHVTDISEDTSILPDRMNEIVAQIEQVAPKKKVEEEETFMTRIAAAAKEQLEAEEGKPPASKKAKKETKKTKKAEEEEFREMVELYQDHHKTKGDTLKDFLR